jgi:hypothetical protein
MMVRSSLVLKLPMRRPASDTTASAEMPLADMLTMASKADTSGNVLSTCMHSHCGAWGLGSSRRLVAELRVGCHGAELARVPHKSPCVVAGAWRQAHELRTHDAAGSAAVPTHLALGPAQAVDCAVHERAQLLGPARQVPAGGGEMGEVSGRTCMCACQRSVQRLVVGLHLQL